MLPIRESRHKSYQSLSDDERTLQQRRSIGPFHREYDDEPPRQDGTDDHASETEEGSKPGSPMGSSPGSNTRRSTASGMSGNSSYNRPTYQIELSPLLGLTFFFGVILLAIIVALFLQLQSVEYQIKGSNHRMMEAIRGTARTSTVYKMFCPNLTPRKTITSGLLANSWDFTTVGMLEQSYRTQGILFGWLTPSETVAFSEEAYAEVMARKCQTAKKFCFGVQAKISSEDSQDGNASKTNHSWGEHHLFETMLLNRLLYLRGMENSVLPFGVCVPSGPPDGPPTGCDRERVQRALKQNPLLFNLISTHAFYEIDAIKRYLEKYQRPLGFSTALLQVDYFSPCQNNPSMENDPICKECQFPCPENMGGPRKCCVRSSRANFNMEGEFYTWSVTDKVVGRHAMLLVGFNDHFQTQQGSEGGFLLKNWWRDGVPTGGLNQWDLYPTGSHSVAYFQQEISRWDELHVCPNSYNPRNWYICGNQTSPAGCQDASVVSFARAVRQPIRLRCVSAEHCNTADANVVYYALNTSASGDMLVTLCVWEYHTNQPEQSKQLCFWAMVWDDLATILQPMPDEVVENDPDRCGFYFFPYRLMQNLWTRFSFAMDWEIQWDAVSYVANSGSTNGQLDYTLIQRSSHLQRSYYFPGPFPIPPYLTGRPQNTTWVRHNRKPEDDEDEPDDDPNQVGDGGVPPPADESDDHPQQAGEGEPPAEPQPVAHFPPGDQTAPPPAPASAGTPPTPPPQTLPPAPAQPPAAQPGAPHP
eukprot:g37305.t1